MQNNIAAIVLGAGKGTRMKSDLPKVMMPVDGKPMIRHILNMLQEAGVEKVVTVIAPDGDLVKKEVAPSPTCVQEKQLGTGHAVLSARSELIGFKGDVWLFLAISRCILRKPSAVWFKNVAKDMLLFAWAFVRQMRLATVAW